MPALPMHKILSELEGYLSSVSGNVSTITVKVLDTNGKIAKRLSTDVSVGVQLLKSKMVDLSNGTYVLNAFNGDVFLKAIKFIKA